MHHRSCYKTKSKKIMLKVVKKDLMLNDIPIYILIGIEDPGFYL